MPDEIENGLMVQITPMFPQFEEDTVRNVIEIVRQGQINQGHPITVASLLPTCIDYLLDMPPETLNDIRSHASNDWRNELDRRRFAGIELQEDRPKFPVAAAVNNGTNKNGGKAKVNGAKNNNGISNAADESILIPNDFFAESFDLYGSDDDNGNFSSGDDVLSLSPVDTTDKDSYDSNEDYSHMRFDHKRRSPLRFDTSDSSPGSTDSDESTQPNNKKKNLVRFDASSSSTTSTNSFRKTHIESNTFEGFENNVFERVTPKNLPSKTAIKNLTQTVPQKQKTKKAKINGSTPPIQNGKAKIEVIDIDHLSPIKVPAPRMRQDIQIHTENMPSTSNIENIVPKKQSPPKQDPIQAAVTQVVSIRKLILLVVRDTADSPVCKSQRKIS